MNARPGEALIEKLKSLPPEQRAAVEDFVDFLKTRRERVRDEAAQRLGEAFAKLDALNLPPMFPEDVQAEIDAVRAARTSSSAHSPQRPSSSSPETSATWWSSVSTRVSPSDALSGITAPLPPQM